MMKGFNPPELKFKRPQQRRKLTPDSLESRRKINQIQLGTYGIQALETGWITINQIESARIILKRALSNKNEKLWIRMRPAKAVTGRTKGIRMGKGKGLPKLWVVPVKKGRILFELRTSTLTRRLLQTARRKLAVRTRVVVGSNFIQL